LQPAIEAADRRFDATFDPLAAAEAALRRAMPPKPTPAMFSPEKFAKEIIDHVKALSAGVPEVPFRSSDDIVHENAVAEWELTKARLEEEVGLTAVNEEQEQAVNELARLQELLAGTKATTLAGLIFKAKYAAACLLCGRVRRRNARIARR
jgi:hypothetical protein